MSLLRVLFAIKFITFTTILPSKPTASDAELVIPINVKRALFQSPFAASSIPPQIEPNTRKILEPGKPKNDIKRNTSKIPCKITIRRRVGISGSPIALRGTTGIVFSRRVIPAKREKSSIFEFIKSIYSNTNDTAESIETILGSTYFFISSIKNATCCVVLAPPVCFLRSSFSPSSICSLNIASMIPPPYVFINSSNCLASV